MQRMQGGLADTPVALHLQQDYLAVIAAQSCLLEQNRKGTHHGRHRNEPHRAVRRHHDVPRRHRPVERLVTALSNVFAVLGAWNDARVTRKALAKLSDRELDDIGLCRGDIEMMGR